MKYAKVFVTNITKDSNVDMEYGIKLHRVVCDCTVEGGKTEKQVYRIFSNQEYESVKLNGYFEIPDYSSVLETVSKQIKETIDRYPDKYPSLSVDDIKVYLQEDLICFQMDEFSHKVKVLNFLSAYLNGEKVSDTVAIAINTARVLEMVFGWNTRRLQNENNI